MAHQKIQKHIEIVRSTITELTSLGIESCDAMQSLLIKHYASVGVSVVNSESDLELLVAKRPDLVFLGVKFIPSNADAAGETSKIWISSFLSEKGITHTGSEQHAIAYESSKPLAKQRVSDAGIKTAPFVVVAADQTYAGADMTLQFPLFVKPASLGGGCGIDTDSVVHNAADLAQKVASIQTKHNADSLIEEYLTGREFSVSILYDEDSKALIAMPIELVAQEDSHGDRMLSKQVKSSNQETVLAVTDPRLRSLVNDVAMRAFEALGARDYGRIDLRLDSAGTPHFLEANLIPSLIKGYGSFPKACMLNEGMGYEDMMLHIVRLGLSRANLPESVKRERAAERSSTYSLSSIIAASA